MEEIRYLTLIFDSKFQTVFQQVWSTEDFTACCKDIINKNSSRLSKLIANIEGLIKVCVCVHFLQGTFIRGEVQSRRHYLNLFHSRPNSSRIFTI